MNKSKNNLNKKDKEYIERLYNDGEIFLHKESDILSADNIELSEEEKREMLEIETQIIIKKRNDFKEEFQGLYSNLSNQYQNNVKANPKKLKALLYEMIEEINIALDKAHNKFKISLTEYAEKQIPLLNELKKTFQTEIINLKKTTKKPGNPKEKRQEAYKYLQGMQDEIQAKDFIYNIKKEFNNENITIEEFNILIALLIHKQFLPKHPNMSAIHDVFVPALDVKKFSKTHFRDEQKKYNNFLNLKIKPDPHTKQRIDNVNQKIRNAKDSVGLQ